MCTVSVKVNEDVLRGVLPELENTAAIRKWAQMLIDARLLELIEQREERQNSFGLSRVATEVDACQLVQETNAIALERDMTPEELYGLVASDIKAIYADGDTETMSIEEARALTHEAIREEYARP